MFTKSFGCSFIFGTDLSDQIDGKASELTWPAVFCKKKHYHYRCYAQGGIGNLAIANSVLEQVASRVTALFIIGWTWIDRFDYIDQHNTWQHIRPDTGTELAQTYHSQLHSQTRDQLTNLITIRTVIDSLQEHDLPFIMTYQDELLFDKTYSTVPAVQILQNYVQPHMTLFEGQTFLNWSRSCGYAESAGWHPLDQAHAAGAEVMWQAFDKQNTNDR